MALVVPAALERQASQEKSSNEPLAQAGQHQTHLALVLPAARERQARQESGLIQAGKQLFLPASSMTLAGLHHQTCAHLTGA